MNEQKIHRIAQMIADDVEAEAGPKVGPVQKAVPVAVGVSAKVANKLLRIAESLVASSGSPKEYYLMENIGRAKYVVNFHDGVQTHKDGSAFYDIRIFRKKSDAEAFMNLLARKGYKYGKRPIYQ